MISLTFALQASSSIVNLNGVASISFPNIPTQHDSEKGSMFTYVDANNTLYYSGFIHIAPEDGILSSEMTEQELQSFYKGVISSQVKKPFPDAVIIKQEPFILPGIRGVSVQFSQKANRSVPENAELRMFLVGRTLFLYESQFITPEDFKSTAFLNSLVVASGVDQHLIQSEMVGNTINYEKAGESMGHIIFYLILIAGFIGFIYKRFLKRNN